MNFVVTKLGKQTTITILSRKLDATVTPELKAEFLILCKPKAAETLIVDLQAVDFCDSSGLSALLIADRAMRQHGGSVRLINVHDRVLDLMKISQLDRLFTIEAS
jgi:anti-anti-sigma factor